ncbi:MAG: hypothetical protein HYV07_01935 [Deltaproteobacteria bacterium]|nr:hypothetical protein [Deltaproteobacteria bacterium]
MSAPHKALNLAEFVEREYPIASGPSSGCFPWRMLSWAANDKNPRLPSVEELAKDGLSYELSRPILTWAESGLKHQPDDRTLVLTLCGLVFAECAATMTSKVFSTQGPRFLRAAVEHLPTHLFDRVATEWVLGAARLPSSFDFDGLVAALPPHSTIRRRFELLGALATDGGSLRAFLEVEDREEAAYRWHAASSVPVLARLPREVVSGAAERALSRFAAMPLSTVPTSAEMMIVSRASRIADPKLLARVAPRAMFFVARSLAEGRASTACAVFDALVAMRVAPSKSFAEAFARANATVPGPKSPAFGRAGFELLRQRPDLGAVLASGALDAMIGPMFASPDPRVAATAVEVTLAGLGLLDELGPLLDPRLFAGWGPASAELRSMWSAEPKLGDGGLWSARTRDFVSTLASRPSLEAGMRLPALRRLRARDEQSAEKIVASGVGTARDFRAVTLEFVVESRTPPTALIAALSDVPFDPDEVTPAIVSVESRWPGSVDRLFEAAFERAREPGKEKDHAASLARLVELRFRVSPSVRAKWIEELESYEKQRWTGGGEVHRALAVLRADQAFSEAGAPTQSVDEAVSAWVTIAGEVGESISGRAEWIPPGLTQHFASLIARATLGSDDDARARLSTKLMERAKELEGSKGYAAGVLWRLLADASAYVAEASPTNLDEGSIFRELRLMGASVAVPMRDPSLFASELVLALADERGITARFRAGDDIGSGPRRSHLCPDELTRLLGALLSSAKAHAGASSIEVVGSPARVSIVFPPSADAEAYAGKLLAFMQGEKVEGFNPDGGAYAVRRILERNAKAFRLGLELEGQSLRVDLEWLGGRSGPSKPTAEAPS